MINFKINDYILVNTKPSQNTEYIDYGVKLVGAPLEWKETMAEGIRVGIIDTGVCETHPDLKNRVKDGVNFTSEHRGSICDYSGHGTHVAGIVAAEKNGSGVVGVAPKADLYIAKAFDKSGKTTYSEAEFNARNMIYQSVKPDFNPNVEYMKDPLSRDIPSVDNSLFILARKLILESK